MSIADKEIIISNNNIAISKNNSSIAENEQKVYDSGKTAEWNAFWDNFLNYGNRKGFNYTFYGWTDEIFCPKYNITPYPRGENNIVSQAVFAGAKIANIKKRLEECGVILDLSNANNLQSYFTYCTSEEVPDLDLSKVTLAQSTFAGCSNLKKLVLNNVRADCGWNNCYDYTGSLTEVYITGEIGKTFSMAQSPLDLASAKRILTCLVNYAGTDSEFTYSVKFSSAVWDLLAADGNTSPNGNSWEDYVNDIGWNK